MNDLTFPERLRVAADLIEAHPDLPKPVVFAYSHDRVDVTWQLMNDEDAKDNQRDAAQRILRAIGGKWAKNPWDDRFDFKQPNYRPGVNLAVYTHRDQVCERRVVGTEDVTIPAVEAQPERVETRELVEWDCSPVLAEAAS